MLTVQEFVQNISEDFKKVFPEVRVEDRFIRLGTEVTHVELPINSMYKEYQVTDYESIKKLYIKISKEILNQYKFKVDYNNVYPILKHTDFGNNAKIQFYRKRAFEDLDVLYVADMTDVFRFFTIDDDVDFNLLEQKAIENISKMTAALVPLNKDMQVYTLRYSTDYASSLLLSEAMNKQIQRKVGDDILIAVPSNSFFLVAKFSYCNQQLLKYLVETDTDPNKVSSAVYRRKNGIYTKVC
ncbi:DUF1444 family protein [Acetivibrio thermocellus]|uniref:DUF1444 family protein n=1 Tax=Acetivibrio thermocellus TaxID=1515 RepID=UPI0010A6A3D4|nr:DUF1444 family protein [Acetivibrio thermocellus]THJ76946.1 DUF1444 family protein [Acetivibrio thermocellus]